MATLSSSFRKISRNLVFSSANSRNLSALVFNSYGAPESVLRLDNAHKNSIVAGPGMLKLSVKSSPFTNEDLLAIGGSSFSRNSTGVAGGSGVGIVSEVGANVAGFSVSDVVFFSANGSIANEVSLPSVAATKIPNLNPEQVAALPALLSAWAILNNFKTLKEGDTVILSAPQDAVSKAIAELGKHYKLKVVIATAADLKDISAFVSKNGAVKLAVSGFPGKASVSLLRALLSGGSLVTYNSQVELTEDTNSLDFPVRSFIFHDNSVHGFDFSSWASNDPSALSAAVRAVSTLIAEKKVVLKGVVYPIDKFTAAISSVVAKPDIPVAIEI